MRKVLIVDDNEDTARLLAMLLRHDGYEARFVSSGEAALTTAAEFEPEVILLDLALPDLNGYEVARSLKQRGSDGKPKVVSLTGHARGQGHGDDSVFDEYLLKPANLDTLRRVING